MFIGESTEESFKVQLLIQDLYNLLLISTHRYMRITGVPLGVSSGEHGVHQDKSAHDLSAQAISFGVAMGHGVCPPAGILVEVGLKAFHDPGSTHGPQALAYHIEQCPVQRHLSRQEQPERHSRVDVSSCSS